MTTPHADLADEFRALARAAIERMEPLLRGAEAEADTAEPWQGCTWCPLCAAAALIKGERHPLITVLARESEHVLVALRTVLRDHLADAAAHGHDSPDHPSTDHHRPDAAAPGAAASGDSDAAAAETHAQTGARQTGARHTESAHSHAATYQPIEVTIDDGSAGN